jgi:uncharacterized DUF497 family protein
VAVRALDTDNAEAYAAVCTPDGQFGTDELVRLNGQWLIQSRDDFAYDGDDAGGDPRAAVGEDGHPVGLSKPLLVYTKTYIQVRFEWDEDGIDFDFAGLAFDDPFAITRQDRDVDGEQRYQLIGAVFTRIVLVAYTIRVESPEGSSDEAPAIRIICARKATPAERKLYEENATH